MADQLDLDDSGEPGSRPLQVVRFVVGGNLFAMDVMSIDEVIQPRAARPIPGQPAFVLGLFELRGQYIPCIDLRHRFSMPATQVGMEKVLIVRCHGRILGLQVDRVGLVDRFEQAEVRPPPVQGQIGGIAPCVGVLNREDEMLLLLDADHLLTDDELQRLPHRSVSS